MAIDARIPLGVQPMQIRSPLAAYGDVERLRAIKDERAEREAIRREREEARRVEREERESERAYRDQGRAREQAKRDVFAKTPRKADGSLDYSRLSGEVAGLDPEASISLAKFGQQEETANLQHRKALLEEDRERLAYTAQVVGSAQDQASWDSALARLAERRIPVEGVSRVFDPRVRDQIVQQGMTHAERVNAEMAKLRQTANKQKTVIAWNGKPVEIWGDPDSGEWTLPDGSKSRSVAHYEKPESGGGNDDVAERQLAADKRQRERDADKWKADAIADLNKERRKPPVIDPNTGDMAPAMTETQYHDGMRAITASWREMRSDEPPKVDTSLAAASRNRVLPPSLRTGPVPPGNTRLATYGQPAGPVAPPAPPPTPPMGPASSAAAPAMPQASTPPAMPASTAPSTPTMNSPTPAATSPRPTPPVSTTPAQQGELRPIPGVPGGVARYDAATGKWQRVR